MIFSEVFGPACAAAILGAAPRISVGIVAADDTDHRIFGAGRGCSREATETLDRGAEASKEIASVLGFQLVSINVRGDNGGSLPDLRRRP